MRLIWDKLAMLASILCMVHCLLSLPALSLMAMLPLLNEEAFHPVMAAVAALLGAPGLVLGYLRHRLPFALAAGSVGLAVLALSLAFGHAQASHMLLTAAGLFLLLGAHVSNWRCVRAAGSRAPAGAPAAARP